MSEIKQIQKPIEAELKEFNQHFKDNILTDSGLLSSIIHYVLKRKGKQLRPILVFLSAGACGEINQKTHNAATLIELMHTATLIHDDVVDESHLRRNFFSINALWKNKVAVLIGDYLLARGLLLSVKNKELDLLEVVSTAVDQMSRGEILQIKKSRQLNITEEEYFEIIEKKTASLIAACSKAGAVSVNAAPEYVEKMHEFGLNLGIAFQIKDDLFDYQMDNKTGKPAGNDIKEKKLTLPVIFARKNSANRERRRLLKIIKSKKQTSENMGTLVNIVHEKGGFEYAQHKMEDYKQKALDCLESLPVSNYREALKELVDFVIDRKE
jgi:octaprenyl-diphosphate synthase